MTHEDFKKMLNELDGQGAITLTEKNARYSSSDDALHNFKLGAEIAGGTPAQACWGYMTKHLVALRDMIMRDDFSNKDDLLEKCQDVINYVRFIWAIGNEDRQRETSVRSYYIDGRECCNCKYSDEATNDEPCASCKCTALHGSAEYSKRPFLWVAKN